MNGVIREARSEAKPFLFVLALVAALGDFLFEYDTGVISRALLFIKPAFHASALQQQAIIGALLVGVMIGVTASGYLAEAITRKWTAGPKEVQRLREIVPLQRLGEPEEMAKVALLLASDRASHVADSTHFVDGGITRHAAGL